MPRPKKLNFDNKTTRNKYGILETQYADYRAEQTLIDVKMVKMREDILSKTQQDIESEFNLATDHDMTERKGARTLFSAAVEKE